MTRLLPSSSRVGKSLAGFLVGLCLTGSIAAIGQVVNGGGIGGGGGSSGTVNSGTAPDVGYYATNGSAISDGGSTVVTTGGVNVTSALGAGNNGLGLSAANTLGLYANGTNYVSILDGAIGASAVTISPIKTTIGLIGAGNGVTTSTPFTVQQRQNTSASTALLAKFNFEDQSSGTSSENTEWQYGGTAVATMFRAGQLFLGGNSLAASSPDAWMAITRQVGNTYSGGYTATGDGHGFADSSTVTRTNGGPIGYNSYDAQPTFSAGTRDFGHYAAFQARPNFAFTGALAEYDGLYASTTAVGSGVAMSAYNGVYVVDAGVTAGGTITTMVGTHIGALTSGGTNWAILTDGTTPSKFGGNVTASSAILNTGITSDATHTDSTVCQDTTTHQFYSGSGTLGVCLGTSSERYKHDIEALNFQATDAILRLQPVSYRYNKGYGNGGERKDYWLTAERTEKVLPQCVPLDKGGKPMTVDPICVQTFMLAAMQEQAKQIKALQVANDNLRKRVNRR